MTELLVGKQQLAILGRRKKKWEVIIKTGDHWDFSANSLRLRVVEAAQPGGQAIVIMDVQKDERFSDVTEKPFRSALCIPVTLPGALSLVIFVEEPNRAMAFSLGVVPAWLELAKGLEGLSRTPAPDSGPVAAVEPPPKKQEEKAEEPPAESESISWPKLICAGLFLFIGVGYAIRSFWISRLEDQLHTCNSNLQNIVTAANMYARNNKNVYPRDLDTLVTAHYLEAIPTCPAAGQMSYNNVNLKVAPPGLSISCNGGYHRRFFHGSGNPETWPVFPAVK